MRAILISSILLAAAFATFAAPTATASDGICVKGLPDYVSPCVEACTSLGPCVGDSPKTTLQWLKDQLGPCTCPPQPQPW